MNIKLPCSSEFLQIKKICHNLELFGAILVSFQIDQNKT